MFGSSSSSSIKPSGSVAARRIPAGFRPNCRFRTLRNPNKREAERRNSRARNAAPVGPPYGWASPVSGRDCRPITRTGAPLGAPPRLFLKPRDRLLETDRGGLYGTPLIPRAFTRFHPLHQPVAGRTHVVGPGGVSRGPRRPGWLGRTLRRRPRSANKRHRLAPSASRDGWNIVAVGDENQAGGKEKSVNSREQRERSFVNKPL
jgi:hypothetical protein